MIVLSVFYFVRIWQAKGKTSYNESYGWKVSGQPISNFSSKRLAFLFIKVVAFFSFFIAVILFGQK
jgi:hypothetical protein